MTKDTCETCRYYWFGFCHRYPPHPVKPSLYDPIKWVRPDMKLHDFCGEHKPKDGK